MTVRVVVADDQDVVRAGLVRILDGDPDLEVVGQAPNGEVAVREVERSDADVCLMDIRMPVLDGLAATRRLCQTGREVRVVILTTFDLDEYVYEALRAGARGFLLKNAGATLLREAVHAAARGDALIDPNVTLRLIAAFTRSAPAGAPPATPLTDREEDVLAAVARGLGNTEVGRELHISLSTVKTHIASIMTKIGARNRVELAIWAAERGRGTAPSRTEH